jgi:hypothetical protein
MENPSNPYAAPVATLADSLPSSSGSSRYEAVGKVVVMWEKLRLLYNAIMIPFAVLMFAAKYLFTQGVAMQDPAILPVGGILANLFFCVGPTIDGYLTWFGFRHRFVTAFLFISGVACTMLLATFLIVFAPGM